MEIRCRQCNGHYELRAGKFGVFAGCSNYPRCRSTIELSEIVQTFIQERGIHIYRWDKTCWKCGKSTPVYSYYLDYELEELDESLRSCGTVGLGDLDYIDQLLAREIPSIQMRYSNTTQSKYMANTCLHCGALQGRNSVVEDPHEIIGELWHDRDMGKYLHKTFHLNNIDSLLPDLRRIYSGGNKAMDKS